MGGIRVFFNTYLHIGPTSKPHKFISKSLLFLAKSLQSFEKKNSLKNELLKKRSPQVGFEPTAF